MRMVLVCATALLIPASAVAADGPAAASVRIAAVEPTPLFPKPTEGQPLTQLVRLKLANAGSPIAAKARIALGTAPAVTQDLGTIAAGKSTVPVHVPDIFAPATLKLELLTADDVVLDVRELAWQPAQKWSIYCVSSSHHDLGFGDYPHRLRTNIRHVNIDRPLEYCRATDNWDELSKFRFTIETSEPLTSFLSSRDQATAREFATRIRQGRIQLGGLHSTVSTEQLGHELMARLFYLTGRHGRDLLDIPRNRTAQIDDAIGLTWPLASFCNAADVPYLFHGYNGAANCMQPASDEPVFFWQAPGGDAERGVLTRSYPYAADGLGFGRPEDIELIIARFAQDGWPYDAILSQDGWDFTLITMENAKKIRAWNAQWAHPRLVCATMDMFFDAVQREANPAKIKRFTGDGNNQWADQDANDAWLLGQARRADEEIPTAEKFATIAQAVAGGGNSWTDLYQAYHRLLTWHEHTNAIFQVGPELPLMRRYETELVENREMVLEARAFAARAQEAALARLTAAINRPAERSLVVFNPLAHERTDVVRLAPGEMAAGDRLVDAQSGRAAPWQTLPDGAVVFVAPDVPALGYRTFNIMPGAPETPAEAAAPGVLENRFYRVAFDATTGTIESIRDKEFDVELVDQAGPHRFNEYLYERFETNDWKVPSVWHRVETAELTPHAGPVAQLMEINTRPTGTDGMKQTVILYHELKRIDFVLDMVKSPSGRRDEHTPDDALGREAVYVALPFAVPEHQIRHELPGCVSKPVADLFDGANTAHYAVRHFSDISGPRFGVTLSAAESALVEYDHPRSSPIPYGKRGDFEKTKTPIATSRMYLYLMNNMFDVNVRWDQAGPVRFSYSVRSHAGDWRDGRADQFGWDNLNPLMVVATEGKGDGRLPAVDSFLSIDQPNVVCTALKPAEANGAGYIVRLVETQGRVAATTVSLPFLPPITRAVETNLVEDDREAKLEVREGNRVAVALAPFGVTTFRVTCVATDAAVSNVQAEAVSDMEVALTWQVDTAARNEVSHYHVYRGTTADFKPSLLNLVERPAGLSCIDRPRLHYGGWINNRLEPGTTYYYRVAAVDRASNEGPASPPVSVSTLPTSETNMRPRKVECLRAVHVSPISRFNVVNLLWRTSCESDVRRYEVYRSTSPGAVPSAATLIATVSADDVIKGGTGYGQTPLDHRAGEYDHMMYLDETVDPAMTYYYRVAAIDDDAQRGAFSDETSVSTEK